jgi:hypothetical protein
MSTNRGPGVYADQGGTDSALNLTAAAVIKSSPGRLVRIAVLASNTSAAATFYDNNSTSSGNVAAAEIFAIPQNATAGTIYYLDWPCNTGITLAAAGGGTFAISYS